MARLMERPEPIRRELTTRGEERRFAQRFLERVNRAVLVAAHQKTEAIELRQALRENMTSFPFQADKL